MKFETINNQLCRIVEPEPLTPEANFPCVVRLIQDDSPMGRYNQSYSEYRYGVRLGCCMLPIIATHIAKNGVVNDIEWDVSRYEIIGYPVADGSAEWALWQMKQGKKVYHKSYTMKTTHCAINDESKVVIFTTPYSVANGGDVVCHADEWLDHRQYGCGVDERTGWQLYEPQPEPAKLVRELLDKQGGGEMNCPKCGEKVNMNEGHVCLTDKDRLIERIANLNARIAKLEAALDKAAHQLYDYSGSCPSDLYDWEHPNTCIRECDRYDNLDEAWKCWRLWLLEKPKEGK
jgi:hypothetical protein